jgi:hypothetical protein
MKLNRSGGFNRPSPLLQDDALTVPGAYGHCIASRGSKAGISSGTAAMSDQCFADSPACNEDERRGRLAEARTLLIAALETLDRYGRSPAAAMVDMAIHHIDTELLS